MEGSIPYRHTHTGKSRATRCAQTTASPNGEHIWWLTEAATLKHPLRLEQMTWAGRQRAPCVHSDLRNMCFWIPVDGNLHPRMCFLLFTGSGRTAAGSEGGNGAAGEEQNSAPHPLHAALLWKLPQQQQRKSTWLLREWQSGFVTMQINLDNCVL